MLPQLIECFPDKGLLFTRYVAQRIHESLQRPLAHEMLQTDAFNVLGRCYTIQIVIDRYAE
jgi:hypothetical protein